MNKEDKVKNRSVWWLAMIASLRSGLDAHRSPMQAATAGAAAAASEARQAAMLDDDDYASVVA